MSDEIDWDFSSPDDAKASFLGPRISVLRLATRHAIVQGILPWRCYVLRGKGRERVVAAALNAFDNAPEKLFPEYPFFPDPLHEPYLSTFMKFRGQLGDGQGVERSDTARAAADPPSSRLIPKTSTGLLMR